jgi:predicted SnoaL-like aldol condensation-catalyzing enzyme
VRSEGELGVPVAYLHQFRVVGAKIVAHWDVIAPIPKSLPPTNGLFQRRSPT